MFTDVETNRNQEVCVRAESLGISTKNNLAQGVDLGLIGAGVQLGTTGGNHQANEEV